MSAKHQPDHMTNAHTSHNSHVRATEGPEHPARPGAPALGHLQRPPMEACGLKSRFVYMSQLEISGFVRTEQPGLAVRPVQVSRHFNRFGGVGLLREHRSPREQQVVHFEELMMSTSWNHSKLGR